MKGKTLFNFYSWSEQYDPEKYDLEQTEEKMHMS